MKALLMAGLVVVSSSCSKSSRFKEGDCILREAATVQVEKVIGKNYLLNVFGVAPVQFILVGRSEFDIIANKFELEVIRCDTLILR